MKDVITTADKKQFIHWFLENYELKNPEAEWLLQYFCSSEQLLSRVHFTDQFRNTPKAFLMSTTCVQMSAFKFYKNKRVTSDVEKAFLDVHNHPEEDVYITLYFHNRTACSEYEAVLESNVVNPVPISPTEVLMGLQAEMWMDHIALRFHQERLRKAIDDALSAGDRTAFASLAREFNALHQGITITHGADSHCNQS